MYRGSDSVFRLSLVGIAFILIFFLLSLFSRMYADTEVARMEAITRLDQRQQEDALPLAQQVFETAQQELQARLSEQGVDAGEVVRTLFDKAKAQTENTALKQRVQELGAQLAGFTEIRKLLTQASRTPMLDGASAETLASALELRMRLEKEFLSTSPGSAERGSTKLADSEIASRTLAAIHFKRNIETLVEKELGIPLVPGQEPAWTQWLVTDSQSFKSNPALSAPATYSPGARIAGGGNNTLRAQIAFLRARLIETHNDNVAPPCWFDDTGNAQFLFTIELRPGNVIVKPAWPSTREAAARAIPGVAQLLANTPTSYTTFTERAYAISRHSGQQCRYSVQVIDSLRSGMRSEKVHQELEAFFHLVDAPR